MLLAAHRTSPLPPALPLEPPTHRSLYDCIRRSQPFSQILWRFFWARLCDTAEHLCWPARISILSLWKGSCKLQPSLELEWSILWPMSLALIELVSIPLENACSEAKSKKHKPELCQHVHSQIPHAPESSLSPNQSRAIATLDGLRSLQLKSDHNYVGAFRRINCTMATPPFVQALDKFHSINQCTKTIYEPWSL